MKFSEVFTSKDNIQLDKKTLVVLRWIAIIGQFITLSVIYFIFRFELPFFFCSTIIAFGALTNFYLQFKIRENQLGNFSSTLDCNDEGPGDELHQVLELTDERWSARNESRLFFDTFEAAVKELGELMVRCSKANLVGLPTVR